MSALDEMDFMERTKAAIALKLWREFLSHGDPVVIREDARMCFFCDGDLDNEGHSEMCIYVQAKSLK